MKRIILSLLTLGIVAVAVTGMTTALLSDEEISSGNTFTAGAVDLGVDNHSYYNGNECAEVETDIWQWVGNAPYPEPGTPCETSWIVDYDIEHDAAGGTEIRRFFAFDDLKPGDWGEDTISLHVDNNDAYLCVDVTLTSDDDNGCTEPEADNGDTSCGDPGEGEGELADEITFYWWADDGDNVYEERETLLPAGPLGAISVGQTATIALADSDQNIWNDGLAPGPVPGDEMLYIGKAWCFGDSDFLPYGEDDSGPEVRPVICDGAPLNNETQTDSATLDISFQAVQSRHNANFFCIPQARDTGLITVTKIVNGGGPLSEGDFALYVDGEPVDTGVQEEVPAGPATVSEVDDSGLYTSVIGGNDCDSNGDVTIAIDGVHSCTITNTYAPADITLDKEVSFTDEVVVVLISDFDLFIDDGVNPPIQMFDIVTETDLPAGTYTVSEVYTGALDITVDADFSGDCSDDGDTGTIIVGANGSATCVIDNIITPNTPPV